MDTHRSGKITWTPIVVERNYMDTHRSGKVEVKLHGHPS
jgi:hypothetical protein